MNSINYMGGWTQETSSSTTTITAIAAGDNSLQMVLDNTGKVSAMYGSHYLGTWTAETASGAGEVAIAAGSNGLQMLLDSHRQVWAQNGTALSSSWSSWTQETPSGEAAVSAG